jgi:hypothetical protein
MDLMEAIVHVTLNANSKFYVMLLRGNAHFKIFEHFLAVILQMSKQSVKFPSTYFAENRSTHADPFLATTSYVHVHPVENHDCIFCG